MTGEEPAEEQRTRTIVRAIQPRLDLFMAFMGFLREVHTQLRFPELLPALPLEDFLCNIEATESTIIGESTPGLEQLSFSFRVVKIIPSGVKAGIFAYELVAEWTRFP